MGLLLVKTVQSYDFIQWYYTKSIGIAYSWWWTIYSFLLDTNNGMHFLLIKMTVAITLKLS